MPMVSNLILFGGIFSLFYLLSFIARIEIDAAYWVAVAALGIFSYPIKSHIFKEGFYDFTVITVMFLLMILLG